jgi:Family of unknown function (DUF6519)
MKTDLTRSTFRREKHYSSVRMQQGRVQLDADWNEQLDIGIHADTTTRVDVIGTCGAPEAAPGFELGVTPDGSDLTISPGRIYVGGVLCELETSPIAIVGASGKNLRLEAIEADGHQLAPGDWVSLAAKGSAPTVAQVASVDAAKDSVTFAAGGPGPAALKTLAAGSDPALTRVCTYLTQPDFPGPRPKTIGLKAGGYLAYLDVWQQNVVALDDREIRETALGGPDTAARTRTVWQLRLFPAKLAKGEKSPTCKSDPSKFPTPTSGRLRARAEPETTATDPCTVPPGAGFRRLENQLYRVEVHDPGALGKATFKWSRENGSVVVRWLGDKGSSVLVDGLGRDDVLGIAQGNLVELTSALDDFAGTPGALVTVNGIVTGGSDGTSLTLASAPPAFPGDVVHPKVRRWENTQTVTSGWITLEDGVEVEFADGWYNTGDYWLIPARTATGDVEWPADLGDPTASPPVPPSPLLRAPEGIAHGYCKLAALSFSKKWTVNEICRPTFPPLTDLPTGGVKEEPGVHVLDVRTATGASLRNDSPVRASEMAAGLVIVCDAEVEPGTIAGKPTVLVTLDLPYPLIPEEMKFWATAAHLKQPFGTTPVTLDCATTAEGPQIEWKPSKLAAQVLKRVPVVLAKAPWLRRELLVHLTLKGNFVYAAGDPKTNVDGEVFGVLKGSVLDGQLPQSGDRRRGGNLDMWFRLVPDKDVTGVVVGVLAEAPLLKTAQLREAAGQVFVLAVDRSKLRQAVPSELELDETVQPDLKAARDQANAAGLPELELRTVIDDRLAGAGELLAQQLGQIGVHLLPEPMAGQAIVEQGAGLAEQGFDLVIAGRDVIDEANTATPELVPEDEQVEL